MVEREKRVPRCMQVYLRRKRGFGNERRGAPASRFFDCRVFPFFQDHFFAQLKLALVPLAQRPYPCFYPEKGWETRVM
jgi:hypothetical protein